MLGLVARLDGLYLALRRLTVDAPVSPCRDGITAAYLASAGGLGPDR